MLLLSMLATCQYPRLTTAEQVENNKQGTYEKKIWNRKKNTPANTWQQQKGKEGFPKYQYHKQMKQSSDWKNNVYPSYGNKLPRQKAANNGWERSNHIWKASQANSGDKRIEVTSAVAQETPEAKESLQGNINNVPHYDKTKKMWEIEKKARSNFPDLKKMPEYKPVWNKNNQENPKTTLETGPKKVVQSYNDKKIQITDKEQLQKKLEDEALQKLRDLDKKILELQAADLLLKRKNVEKEKVNTVGGDVTSGHSTWFQRNVLLNILKLFQPES